MADASNSRSQKFNRPLSPHLKIYRPQINMVMSIFHRLTGTALYFGTLVLTWWLAAAAAGPDDYTYVSEILASWPGKIVLFGFTWALMHHLFGGLRHFIWDSGHGYDLKTVDLLSWGTLALSVLATAGIWFLVCSANGGL